MRILSLNCGTATVKFQLMTFPEPGSAANGGLQTARGLVETAGPRARLRAQLDESPSEEEVLPARDACEAVTAIFDWLREAGPDGLHPEAVGHRLVHGGEDFRAPTLLTDEVLRRLRGLVPLAPLHLPASLVGIEAAREALGPAVPQVGVFDTAFHASLPPAAAAYAIPRALAASHRIRRYGFHGIAHQYLAERCAELEGRPSSSLRLVQLHLGSGASACAVDGGRSVEVSMGLTPLEGLIMSTRSGDVDPALVTLLERKEGAGPDAVERLLNEESGLLGVSGRSDMRQVLAGAAAGDAGCRLALEMYVHRVKKYLGAYLAILGGADAVVFSGGVGSGAESIREEVCRGMEWCGLRLDGERNRAAGQKEARISSDESAVSIWSIPANEELLIARETLRTINEGKLPAGAGAAGTGR